MAASPHDIRTKSPKAKRDDVRKLAVDRAKTAGRVALQLSQQQAGSPTSGALANARAAAQGQLQTESQATTAEANQRMAQKQLANESRKGTMFAPVQTPPGQTPQVTETTKTRTFSQPTGPTAGINSTGNARDGQPFVSSMKNGVETHTYGSGVSVSLPRQKLAQQQIAAQREPGSALLKVTKAAKPKTW